MHILAYDCLVEPDRMEIQDPVLYALLLTGNKKVFPQSAGPIQNSIAAGNLE